MAKKVTIKQIAEISSGSTAPKEEFFSDTGLPFIRAGHLEKLIENRNIIETLPKVSRENAEKLKLKKVGRGTILFAKSGMSATKNRVYKCTGDAYIVNHLAGVTPDQTVIESGYLQYFFEWFSPSKLIIDESYPSIRISDIGNIELTLPNKEYQKKIVNILDHSRDLINKRKAQIEALDQLTQSVFLEMFGDPKANPKNFPVGTIKDLSIKTQYGTSKKADEKKGRYPILRMNNITYNGGWDLSSLKYIDLDEKEKEKYLVNKGELLFNRTNSKELVGKTAVFRKDEPMAYAGYLVKLTCNERANGEFISAYLNSKYGKAILFSMAKNIVGMANINAKELQNITIYIPPKDLQDKFADINLKILENREVLIKGLDRLEENYLSLIQRAFKGKLFTEEKLPTA